MNSDLPICPRCHSNENVKPYTRFSSAIKGVAHYVGSGIMYLSTPIGKGASQDEARRLARKASSDFADKRYHCSLCNTDFDL